MIIDLNKTLELKSLELYVKEVRKRGMKIKIGDIELKLSDFDTQKNEVFEELKNVKYNDLEDLVYRMQITYDEIMENIDLKYIPTKRSGFSINPGFYGVADSGNTLKHILPDIVKVSVTIDDVRLKSKLKTYQTLIITKKSFFYTLLGFTQPHQDPLNDIEGF